MKAEEVKILVDRRQKLKAEEVMILVDRRKSRSRYWWIEDRGGQNING